MHAANLLNKRRQHREEQHRHPAVTKKHTNPSLLEPSASNPSLCSTAAGVSTRPLPPVPSPLPVTASTPGSGPPPQSQLNGCPLPSAATMTTTTTTCESNNMKIGFRDQPLLAHYSDHMNCANIGILIMIAGVVIMIISGFICYLIGFGEPGVIIGVGGAGFVLIGLIVLSFGNSWYTSREKAKRMPPPGFDVETGRARSVKRFPQEPQTNRSGLNAVSGPTSGVEFRGIISE